MCLLLLLMACHGGAVLDTATVGPVVVTFNTGTPVGTAGLDPDDDWTEELGAISDEWYGNGLAWLPAVDAARDFFAQVHPDVVVFQEIFDVSTCPDIPTEAREGFVCQDWRAGDPTVPEQLLGEGYQIACHPGHADKCAAVALSFGHLQGCEDGPCPEGLEGFEVDGCGHGARVARGVIETVEGQTLTLVSVHGTSGFSTDEQACRVAQVDQVFVDLGDGAPGASGARNLVMGDLNTDPGRLADTDTSAARWDDFVGDDKDFHFITRVGPDAPGTYQDVLDIDHVISDVFTGDCWSAGRDGHPPVLEQSCFDHRPAVCTLR